MPSKAIGKEAYLWAKGFYGLSKDLGPKKHPNNWKKNESKETRVSMKVKEGGVHQIKYNGFCMKQWIRISKAIWTSLILGRRSTCWTSFRKASLMKDDKNDKVPNGIHKIQILFDGVLNYFEVLKSNGKLKGDLITNLAFHDFIVEIMQNSFNHNLYISRTNIVYWKRIWDMDLLKDTKSVWHLFIHRFIFRPSTHLSVCQISFQYMVFVCKMYEPMNERTSHEFH
jgi:hypothetical protein